MAKPDIYIQPTENKFVEIVRITWIISGIGFFIFAGALISLGEWISGKDMRW